MHCLNSNIFLPTFLSLPFLTEQSKVRLIEWKARVDLALYASRHPLEPLPDVVTNYPTNKSWQQAAHATITHPGEDGHASKLVRMLGLGEKVCKGYEGKEGFLVQGDMWLRLANMCKFDSVFFFTLVNTFLADKSGYRCRLNISSGANAGQMDLWVWV